MKGYARIYFLESKNPMFNDNYPFLNGNGYFSISFQTIWELNLDHFRTKMANIQIRGHFLNKNDKKSFYSKPLLLAFL